MNSRNRFWIAATLLAVSFLLFALASGTGQRSLQRVKYGDPIAFCVGEVSVKLEGDWQIAMLKTPNHEWPLFAGLFPVPLSFAGENSTLAQVSLRSSKHDGEVSIHNTKNISATEAELRNCRTNQFCEMTVSVFDARYEVMKISNIGTTWIKYIDKPIMIGLYGPVGDSVASIVLDNCSG